MIVALSLVSELIVIRTNIRNVKVIQSDFEVKISEPISKQYESHTQLV